MRQGPTLDCRLCAGDFDGLRNWPPRRQLIWLSFRLHRIAYDAYAYEHMRTRIHIHMHMYMHVHVHRQDT
jgi:hypothetical protein